MARRAGRSFSPRQSPSILEAFQRRQAELAKKTGNRLFEVVPPPDPLIDVGGENLVIPPTRRGPKLRGATRRVGRSYTFDPQTIERLEALAAQAGVYPSQYLEAVIIKHLKDQAS